MEKDERPIFMRVQNEYVDGENMVFIFANGKGVRTPLKSYETKGNRKVTKLKGAYSLASPLVGIFYEKQSEPFEIMMISDQERAIILNTTQINIKSTKASGGCSLMTLGRREKAVARAITNFKELYGDLKGLRKKIIPATGLPLGDKGEQLSMYDQM